MSLARVGPFLDDRAGTKTEDQLAALSSHRSSSKPTQSWTTWRASGFPANDQSQSISQTAEMPADQLTTTSLMKRFSQPFYTPLPFLRATLVCPVFL
ncbi:hypothetical protein RRG08_060873 [Elysia crispata]|uniref:Uncharacterized protein n=1 Tax=Elysia crispata TaxID=231223 RepID=A0AAE1DFC8_9GAST|nr:hypothetical protein RRG08_060873 [Elysia crispata]